ncbi:type I restriction enzyme, S subunit [Candidatus Magnetomoraceae bacterium gMMP-15]
MNYTLQSVEGHDWLGAVPAEWEIGKLKYLFWVSKEKNGHSPLGEMLSVSGYRGIEIKEYEYETQKRTTEELQEYRVVHPNQLVVNTMWLNYAGLGVSEFTGYVSPAYRSYYIDESLFPRYVHHLMRSDIYVRGYTKYMQGIRPNSLQIKTDDFNSFPILIPSYDEQTQIANFLDHETAKIDTLIEKQQQLIKLLKEKRQAVISHAVTKGLNPDAPMRDSGVEWLGEVPEHWDIMKISHFAILKSGDGIISEQIKVVGEYPVFGGNGLRGYFNEFNHDGNYVLIGRQGALCGNINFGEGKFWASEHAIVVYPQKKIHYKWLGETLRSMNLNQYSISAAQPGLTVSNITLLKIPFPSELEQGEIAEFINTEKNKINNLIQKSEAAIKLMQERRTALISAAVTGKIDIRNWQAPEQNQTNKENAA